MAETGIFMKEFRAEFTKITLMSRLINLFLQEASLLDTTFTKEYHVPTLLGLNPSEVPLYINLLHHATINQNREATREDTSSDQSIPSPIKPKPNQNIL